MGFTFSFILIRNTKALMGCVTAVAVFVALRLYSFGLDAAGVYVFDTTTASLSNVTLEKLRNSFSLPFGPVVFNDVFTSSGISIANRSGLLLMINLCVYGLIAFLFARFLRPIKLKHIKAIYIARITIGKPHALILIAGLSTFMSFLFDAYVGANYRYAFNLLPFLFIAMAGLPFHIGAKRIVFGLFFCGSIIASGPSMARLYSDFEFEKFRYQIIRDLFDVLRLHHDAKHIVILNDFVLGYANPNAMEILVPFEGQIDRGTSLYLDGCNMAALSKIETRIEKLKSESRITVMLPECGRFTFESSPKLPEFVAGNLIKRNDQIHYEFRPDPKSENLSVRGWTGRDLTIVTRSVDILYFDFVDNTWKLVRASEQ